MKTSIKIDFLVILLLPIIACSLLFVSANYFEPILNSYPANELAQTTNNTTDLSKLKELNLASLETIQLYSKEFIGLHYNYMTVLLAFIILNTISLISIFRYCKQSVSNKSSNLTGANDAPSS